MAGSAALEPNDAAEIHRGGELCATIAMDYDLDEDDEDADLFGPGGWWLICEPDVQLVEILLVPDVAGWRRERMSAWPDTEGFTVAPDWICEIVGDAADVWRWVLPPACR